MELAENGFYYFKFPCYKCLFVSFFSKLHSIMVNRVLRTLFKGGSVPPS